jgi:hypothetical protein
MYSKKDLEGGMKWNVIGIYLLEKWMTEETPKKKQEDTSANFSSSI